ARREVSAVRCLGSQRRMATSPRVAAAASAYVPASIRSGITAWLAPWSRSTPSISIVSEPAPRIRAPIAVSSITRSATSRAVAPPCRPLREGGCRHPFLVAGHRHRVEDDLGAADPLGLRLDVAVFEPHLRSQLLERREMEVDRPHADRAAAGQGDSDRPGA